MANGCRGCRQTWAAVPQPPQAPVTVAPMVLPDGVCERCLAMRRTLLWTLLVVSLWSAGSYYWLRQHDCGCSHGAEMTLAYKANSSAARGPGDPAKR